MTLLDQRALERARREAGLLPLDLARQLNASTDTTAAILARGAADEHLTLADLRPMAAAVAVHPRQLLADDWSHRCASRPLVERRSNDSRG